MNESSFTMLFAELDSGQCGYFFVFLAIGDSRVFLLNENQKKKLDNKQQTVLVYGKMQLTWFGFDFRRVFVFSEMSPERFL
ncbi:TPA: hypothetical protein U2B93_000145 [Streptococcus suis]|uniref:hypothetical protein n=1 Tax=Streptococcus suis TaxID=1307 RepID=UPI0013793910|nr:hypothetical protein [Streptococcus suis]MDW8713614.1 hypothetical protein [Streptococcus suis]HEM4684589.1 hypothetical protein [Streptococcus suis]HEM6090375.1 hypothetical protein [Streptococcus suis]